MSGSNCQCIFCRNNIITWIKSHGSCILLIWPFEINRYVSNFKNILAKLPVILLVHLMQSDKEATIIQYCTNPNVFYNIFSNLITSVYRLELILMKTKIQTANKTEFSVDNKNRNPLMVGILIFDQVEVLDVAGPYEVFSVTRLNETRRFDDTSPFRVVLIAETLNQISAIGGLRLTPDVTFDGSPDLDLLLVPGGLGTREEVHNTTLVKWISSKASRTGLTASVCTGSSLLGKAGLLDGRDATTHWRAFDFLSICAPKAHIKKDVQFTLDEPIFTSAGVAAGIDLALRIVSHFFGSETGQATARHMEYPYPRSDQMRRD